MVKAIKRTWVVLVGVLALVAFAPAAHAINVDFFCGPSGPGTPCNALVGTGTVTLGGGNATGNFSVFNNQGIFGVGTQGPWTASFNTATGSVQITGLPGGLASGTFSTTPGVGFTIAGTTTTTVTLLGVVWSVLPPLVQGALGTATGLDNTTITIITSGGSVQSTDVLITPIPEPTSMVLLGSALVAAGSFLRRRKRT